MFVVFVWNSPVLAVNLYKGRLQKNGLFSDIDQISFNTHPTPPKDDIWQKLLGVGKFTSLPPTHHGEIMTYS